MRNSSSAIFILAAAALVLPPSATADDLNATAIERIAAAPGSIPFTFVLIGDPQGQYETFRTLLSQCAELNPRFVIVLGDLTPRGGQEDYDAYASIVRASSLPILSVIGNHDIPTGGRARYEALFGKGDRFFDFANCRFILLDNADQKLAPEQVEWLDGALATKNRKFIAMHCPPFLGNWWYDSFMGGTRRFLELVSARGVKRVFMGHLHMVDSLFYEGVDYLVCGSGGIAPVLLPFGEARVCLVSVTVSADAEKVTIHPAR